MSLQIHRYCLHNWHPTLFECLPNAIEGRKSTPSEDADRQMLRSLLRISTTAASFVMAALLLARFGMPRTRRRRARGLSLCRSAGFLTTSLPLGCTSQNLLALFVLEIGHFRDFFPSPLLWTYFLDDPQDRRRERPPQTIWLNFFPTVTAVTVVACGGRLNYIYICGDGGSAIGGAMHAR